MITRRYTTVNGRRDSVATVLMKRPGARVGTDRPEPTGGARRRRSDTLLCVLVVAYTVLLIPAVSYLQALLYPGPTTVSARSEDWLREHGAGPLIEIVERW